MTAKPVMIASIIAFEWRYAVRRPTFAAAAGFFALMGFMLAASGYGDPDVRINGPYAIAQAIGLLSLVSIFAVTVLCAPSILRDGEHRMAELVYTTGVTERSYLLGRFTGSFLAAVSAFALGVVGLAAGGLAVAHAPERLGPFRAVDYLWPFAVLALPSMFFAAAVLFAVAALGRSALATYAGGIFLYGLYFAAAIYTDSPLMAGSSPAAPGGLATAALADPFGLSAFFEQTQYWTAAERDARRLALAGPLLNNRLLWTAVALAILALTDRLFAFRLPAGKRGRGDSGTIEPVEPGATAATRAPAAAYRAVAPSGRRGRARGAALIPPLIPPLVATLISMTRLELRFLLRSRPFVAVSILWAGTVGLELAQAFRQAELATALVPTTGLIVGHLGTPLTLFGLLALVFFGAEVAWRERLTGVAETIDATPAPNGLLVAAKLVALSALVVVATAVAVAVATLFQLAIGGPAPAPALYASLLYFVGLPLVLVAVLTLLIQAISPERHAGMLTALLAVGFWHRGAFGGPDHPLLRFAAAPAVPYSALDGFSPAATSFAWQMAYWTAFAALLALLTGALWPRGTDARLAPRIAALGRPWRATTRVWTIALGLAFALLGGAIAYQTEVLNGRESEDALADWKAAYERKYRHLEVVAQPSVVDVVTEVDLFPSSRRVEARGRYRLENRTAEPVDTVWVAARRDLDRVALSLDGAEPSAIDRRFRMYRFDLARPLLPGASVELAFALAAARRGATAGEVDHSVVANGSFVLSVRLMPSIGYRRGYELRDPDARRRRGLALPSRPETVEASLAAQTRRNPPKIAFEAVVSTAGDQIAVTSGALIGTWREDGRRFFHYRAERPMTPAFAIVSARYATASARHAGTVVEVFHHPGHDRNVARILDAATRALDTFGRRFGAYPLPYLRIVEVPAYWQGFAGLALPGIVYLVEDRVFLTDVDASRVDVVTKRVAHEVAHQWWGHRLVPAEEPGASALVESLARYSELLALAEVHGEAAVDPVLAIELDRYLAGRTDGDEVPLYQVTDQGYLYYAKGALVTTATRDLLGEAAFDRALRDLLVDTTANANANEEDEPPSSLDLLARLEAIAPPEQRILLDQWWRRIVLYDLRIAAAEARPLGDGRYRVDLAIDAAKHAIEHGEELPLAMDETLDVAVYADRPGAAVFDRAGILRAVRHRVEGATELSLVVDDRPAYVAIDPFLRRIDRNRADNVRRVRVHGAG